MFRGGSTINVDFRSARYRDEFRPKSPSFDSSAVSTTPSEMPPLVDPDDQSAVETARRAGVSDRGWVEATRGALLALTDAVKRPKLSRGKGTAPPFCGASGGASSSKQEGNGTRLISPASQIKLAA